MRISLPVEDTSIKVGDRCPWEPPTLHVGLCLLGGEALHPFGLGYEPYPGVDSPLVEGAYGNPLTAQQINYVISRATYVIHAQNEGEKWGSQGSGVAVGVHTIATNCHVVMWQSQNHHEDGSSDEKMEGKVPFDRKYGRITVIAQEGDGTSWPAEIASSRCEDDIALLHTDADVNPAKAIRTFEWLQKGDTVFANGAPRGLGGTFTTGIIANILKDQDYTPQMARVNLVISTAPIDSGNSGGPLFDAYGNLTGLNQASLPGNLFVVIPMAEVMRKRY